MAQRKGGCDDTRDCKKTVRFHPKVLIVETQHNNSSLWYTKDDYEYLHRTSRLIAREIRRLYAGKVNCINIAYHAAGKLASSSDKKDEKELDMSVIPLNETLSKWCSTSANVGRHSRRGLERHGSKSHNADRALHQRSAIRDVLAEQDKQRKQKRFECLKEWRLQQQQQREKQRRQEECAIDNEYDINRGSSTYQLSDDRSNKEECSEDIDKEEMNLQKLRTTSMASTRRARVFARMLGEADAAEAIQILKMQREEDFKCPALHATDAAWEKVAITTTSLRVQQQEQCPVETKTLDVTPMIEKIQEGKRLSINNSIVTSNDFSSSLFFGCSVLPSPSVVHSSLICAPLTSANEASRLLYFTTQPQPSRSAAIARPRVANAG